MDSVAVSRRNHTNRKGNKENAQPARGSKSLIHKDKTSVAPLHLKSNEKEATLAKNVPLKAKTKQVDTKSMTGEALKKVKTEQKDGKGAVVSDVRRRQQTYGKAFLTEQAVRNKKIAAEAPRPPPAVQSSRPAPGMFKGKIVQSKIGSIWKSSASLDRAEPSAPKVESQRVGNVTKNRSKSVADLHGTAHGTHKPATTRSKSVSNGPCRASNPAVTSRPPAGFSSARPLARTVPAKLTSTSSRHTAVAPTKGSGTLNSKPKFPGADKKVNKPPVSSTISQYRFTMETAEEKRAKLAEWLASKGKTFKRPAMTTAAPPKTKPSKPETGLKSQSHVEPQPTPQCKHEPEPSLEEHKQDSTANCAHTNGAELTQSQTPVIMNTTLDLLENSDVELSVDPQDRVDDIVLNLCDALEAMETPSRCCDELSQVSDKCDVQMKDGNAKDECKKEEVKDEILEDVSKHPELEQVKNAEESDKHKVQMDDAEVQDEDEEEEDDDDDDDCVETTPQMEDASVVKYSVRTTPYLQSVKKTIEGETSASTSRRKSNIKDLKFLTPVRRSCRIQRKSSKLPMMLVDHDPCVSSLAELVKLDDDPNAYIYRKNPALLEDLPDHPRL